MTEKTREERSAAPEGLGGDNLRALPDHCLCDPHAKPLARDIQELRARVEASRCEIERLALSRFTSERGQLGRRRAKAERTTKRNPPDGTWEGRWCIGRAALVWEDTREEGGRIRRLGGGRAA